MGFSSPIHQALEQEVRALRAWMGRGNRGLLPPWQTLERQGQIKRLASRQLRTRPRLTKGLCAIIGFVFLAAALPTAASAAECTTTYTGPAEGSWQNAANWSTGKVPSATDVACVGSGKTAEINSGTAEAAVLQGEGAVVVYEATLELLSGSEQSSINSLTLKFASTLKGSGSIKVTSSFAWTNESTMSGSGVTTLGSGVTGSVTTGGGSGKLVGRTLISEGSLALNSGQLALSESAVFENKGSVTANQTGMVISGGSGGTVINKGTIQKTAGEEPTRFDIQLTNYGTLKTTSGSFSAEYRAWTLASGSTLEGNLSVKQGASITGGSFDGSGAAVTIRESSLAVEAETEAVVDALTLEYQGEVKGPGTLAIESTLSMWIGSKMSGTGTTVLESGASGSLIEGGGSATIKERTFVNNATFTIAKADLTLTEGAILENNGTLYANIASQGTIASTAGGQATLVNNGTFSKNAGSGSSWIRVDVENSGTIEATSGTLLFRESANPSTIQLESGSDLAGSVRFEKVAVESQGFSATGLVSFREASLLLEKGEVSAEELELEYKTNVSGSGNVSISKALIWKNESEIGGSGKITLQKGSNNRLDWGGETATLANGELINEGTFTQTSGMRLKLKSAAIFRNRGTYNLNAEPYPIWVQGMIIKGEGSPRFINTGTFRRTEGSNEVTVEPDFVNLGLLGPYASPVVIENKVTVAQSERFGNRCHCGDPVEVATGDFSESQTDFAIGGRGVGLVLTRTYSAQAAATAGSPGAFGYGWTSTFSDHLISEEGGKRLTLVRGDGSTVPFTESKPGTFSPPSWSQETLTGSSEAGYTLTTPDQTKYDFSGTGRLESLTDRNGNETTIGYTESGKLETITDPVEREITFTYNGEGLIEKAEDPMGHTVKYAYEGKDLKTVTLPGEASANWTFKYDGSHRMTEMIDGRSGKTTNEYDGSSRVKSQTDPASRTTTLEYAAFHTKVTNKSTGAVTDYWFTSNNEPFSVTRGFGTASATTETFSYDEAGRLLSRTDGNGHTTSYGYNPAGDRTSATDPAENQTKWTYNETHDVLTMTTPEGEKTTIERDEQGNPETISRPAPEKETQTTSFEYGPHGEVEAITDPLERTTSFEYDANGNLKAAINPEGDKRTWGYDEDSRVTSMVSPRGNEEGAEAAKFTTTIERDAQDRPSEVIDPLGNVTKYAYDPNGNLETLTDPKNHKTKYTYNANDELTKVEKPNGNLLETGYDGAGQVTSQTDGNKNTTTYKRNILEQPTEVIDPLERKTTLEYDLAGNLESETDPDARKTSYAYDAADRLKEISYSDEVTPTAKFTYNKDSQLKTMTDGTGESVYSYDQLGRLTESENGHGDTVGYEYNLANEPIELTYPNGEVVSQAFDAAGRLETVSDWLGHTITFAYNRDSRVKSTTFPEGTGNVDEYTYDRADLMSEVKAKKGAETLASLAYTRDKAGLLEKQVSKGLPGTEETSFEYDANDRLTKAGGGSYEYDAADNLTKAPGTTNAYDKASQLEAGTGTTYTFNKEGERTKRTPAEGPATAYEYDQAGNLTAVERTKEGEVPAIVESFGYDGTGLMASHKVGEATSYLTWNESNPLPLLLSDGQNNYLYGPSGLPVEQISSEETPTYYHHDQLGSTRMLTNGGGEVTGTFTYSPYGTLEGSTGSATTPLGFAGQYTLPQSGLQYLRARMYDPRTGQFMSRDPIELLTRQAYIYADSSPVNVVDPTGLYAPAVPLEAAPTCLATPVAAAACAGTAAAACAIIAACRGAVGSTASDVYDSLSGQTEIAGNLTISKPLAERLAKEAARNSESDEEPCPDITFGHGDRHLTGTDLTPEEVESAIEDQVQSGTNEADDIGDFRGRVRVGGHDIEYRGHGRANGQIHIGTYYPTR
jgi:RHS repeat-associated protein